MQNSDAQYQMHLQSQQITDLNAKAEQFQRLSAAIRSMYQEFNEDKQKSIQTDEPPLIILDKLRSSLRLLLFSKKEYEQQMKVGIQNQLANQQSSQKSASDKLEEKIQQNRKLEEEINRYKTELAAANQERNKLIKDHEQKLTEFQAKSAAMLQENAKMRDLDEQLKQAVVERDRLIKNRDTRLGRIAELEARLQQAGVDNQNEINQARTKDAKRIYDLEDQNKNFQKQLREGGDKDQQIRELENQLKSFKNNLSAKNLDIANRNIILLNEKLAKKEQELMEQKEKFDLTNNELQSLRLKFNAHEKDFQKLQEDYDLINKRKQKTEDKKEVSAQEKQQIVNMYSEQTYEKKLHDKDKEIEELASRVRRLLALQHKANLSQKAFQEEKQSLEKQIQNQRDEIAQLRRITTAAKLPDIQKKEVNASEEILRDLQNMKSFGVTASAALNQTKSLSRQVQMRPVTAKKFFELDKVPDDVRPQTGNVNKKQELRGKGVGYGAGSMLGGLDVGVTFGVQ